MPIINISNSTLPSIKPLDHPLYNEKRITAIRKTSTRFITALLRVTPENIKYNAALFMPNAVFEATEINRYRQFSKAQAGCKK